MSNGMNRRDLLKTAGAATAAMFASPLLQWASAQTDKPRKILFFTRSQGFQHSTVTRPASDPNKLSFAEQFMVDFGKKHNMEFTCTKDGKIFTDEGLAPFDMLMFYTTGRLEDPLPPNSKSGAVNNMPWPKDGIDVLLKFVGDGKGFLGVHSATDTMHGKNGQVDPYTKMIGGEFLFHSKQQKAKIHAVEKSWGPLSLEDFEKTEEWYVQKNLAPDMQVLLIQDTKSMEEDRYNKLPPYPETWARMQGKGRVFYTSMGHREDIWKSKVFHTVLLGGLQWACGNAQAEVKPNITQVTPDAMIDKSAGA